MTKKQSRIEYMKEYGKQYRLKNKESINKRMEKYRIEHREEIYEHNKRYQENNKEKIAEYFKQYRQSHKEQLKEKDAQYYRNNREGILEYSKQYKKDNPEKSSGWSKQFYDKRREFMNKYKLSKGCQMCGYNKCASALEFHHKGNKEFIVAHLLLYKMEAIKKEINKCIILCANCHRELHEEEKEGERYAINRK